MKKILFVTLAAAVLYCLAPSCSKNNDVTPDEESDSRVDDLMNRVATLEEQAKNIDSTILVLKGMDAVLDSKLDSLDLYVNDTLLKTKDWVSATFATLAQYDALCTTVAAILPQCRKDVSDSLARAMGSMKNWVNAKFTGYWTIAQTQARLDSLGSIEKADSAALAADIAKARSELTAAYTAAISDAITTLEGKLNTKIAADIKTASDALNVKIAAIDTRLTSLEKTVENLVARIQKIDLIPNHASGGVWIKTIAENEFNFLISPDSLASKLLAGFNADKTSFILLATRSLTKAATFDTIRFAATVTESGGVLTFKVDGKQSNNKFCKNFYTACLQIKDSVNCSTSGFFPLARPVYPEAPDSACITIGTTIWASVNCGYDATNYKYGKLYQWGRKNGCGYKATDTTAKYNDTGSLLQTTASGPVSASSEDAAKFYKSSSSDWLTPQDGTRWNSGTEASPIKTSNDPCPAGWRVPTYAELNTLIANAGGGGIGGDGWDINKNGYWFNGTTSPSVNFGLFLPAAGYRDYSDGDAYDRGSGGFYWSSSVDGDDAWYLYFGSDRAGMVSFGRAHGFPVRCVQE